MGNVPQSKLRQSCEPGMSGPLRSSVMLSNGGPMLVAPATTVAAAKFLHKSKAKRVSALVSEFEGVPDKEGGEEYIASANTAAGCTHCSACMKDGNNSMEESRARLLAEEEVFAALERVSSGVDNLDTRSRSLKAAEASTGSIAPLAVSVRESETNSMDRQSTIAPSVCEEVWLKGVGEEGATLVKRAVLRKMRAILLYGPGVGSGEPSVYSRSRVAFTGSPSGSRRQFRTSVGAGPGMFDGRLDIDLQEEAARTSEAVVSLLACSSESPTAPAVSRSSYGSKRGSRSGSNGRATPGTPAPTQSGGSSSSSEGKREWRTSDGPNNSVVKRDNWRMRGMAYAAAVEAQKQQLSATTSGASLESVGMQSVCLSPSVASPSPPEMQRQGLRRAGSPLSLQTPQRAQAGVTAARGAAVPSPSTRAVRPLGPLARALSSPQSDRLQVPPSPAAAPESFPAAESAPAAAPGPSTLHVRSASAPAERRARQRVATAATAAAAALHLDARGRGGVAKPVSVTLDLSTGAFAVDRRSGGMDLAAAASSRAPWVDAAPRSPTAAATATAAGASGGVLPSSSQSALTPVSSALPEMRSIPASSAQPQLGPGARVAADVVPATTVAQAVTALSATATEAFTAPQRDRPLPLSGPVGAEMGVTGAAAASPPARRGPPAADAVVQLAAAAQRANAAAAAAQKVTSSSAAAASAASVVGRRRAQSVSPPGTPPLDEPSSAFPAAASSIQHATTGGGGGGRGGWSLLAEKERQGRALLAQWQQAEAVERSVERSDTSLAATPPSATRVAAAAVAGPSAVEEEMLALMRKVVKASLKKEFGYASSSNAAGRSSSPPPSFSGGASPASARTLAAGAAVNMVPAQPSPSLIVPVESDAPLQPSTTPMLATSAAPARRSGPRVVRPMYGSSGDQQSSLAARTAAISPVAATDVSLGADEQDESLGGRPDQSPPRQWLPLQQPQRSTLATAGAVTAPPTGASSASGGQGPVPQRRGPPSGVAVRASILPATTPTNGVAPSVERARSVAVELLPAARGLAPLSISISAPVPPPGAARAAASTSAAKSVKPLTVGSNGVANQLVPAPAQLQTPRAAPAPATTPLSAAAIAIAAAAAAAAAAAPTVSKASSGVPNFAAHHARTFVAQRSVADIAAATAVARVRASSHARSLSPPAAVARAPAPSGPAKSAVRAALRAAQAAAVSGDMAALAVRHGSSAASAATTVTPAVATASRGLGQPRLTVAAVSQLATVRRVKLDLNDDGGGNF